jgi:hypothetical protein
LHALIAHLASFGRSVSTGAGLASVGAKVSQSLPEAIGFVWSRLLIGFVSTRLLIGFVSTRPRLASFRCGDGLASFRHSNLGWLRLVGRGDWVRFVKAVNGSK